MVVTLAPAEGSAVLTVRDDGPGLPAERAEEVFGRFIRLDDARSAAGGGAGLGLAIARDVAERHGGTLVVDDGDAASPGACLVLRLPLAGPPGPSIA